MQLLLLIQSFRLRNNLPCMVREGEKKKNKNLPQNLGSHPLHHFSFFSNPKNQILTSVNGLRTCRLSSLSCSEQSLFDKALENALRCYCDQWDKNMYLNVFTLCGSWDQNLFLPHAGLCCRHNGQRRRSLPRTFSRQVEKRKVWHH